MLQKPAIGRGGRTVELVHHDNVEGVGGDAGQVNMTDPGLAASVDQQIAGGQRHDRPWNPRCRSGRPRTIRPAGTVSARAASSSTVACRWEVNSDRCLRLKY